MASSSHNYVNTSNHTPNTRLLWRGSLLTQTGSRLHGLAIVAHSINPKAASQAKHDPFSDNSYSQSLNDTCLEIEMLRGRDLLVDKLTSLTLEQRGGAESCLDQEDHQMMVGSRKSCVASLLKGKGTGPNDLDREISFSDIDCNPQVRLYVDPRCSQTHHWILSQFGKRELHSTGITRSALIVRLDSAADDQISSQLVIFARAVEMDSSTSDAAIPLQLVIGQRKPPRIKPIARPDDPMPRVIPSLLFTDSKKSGVKKSIGTLVNHTTHTSSGSTANPSLAKSISGKNPLEKTRAGRQDILNTHVLNSQKRNFKAIKRPANTPGRRMKAKTSFDDEEEMDEDSYLLPDAPENLSPRRSEKRKSTNISSYSTKKVKTVTTKTIKTGSQFEFMEEEREREKEATELESENGFPADRSPSPSPSPFTYQPTADRSNPYKTSELPKTSKVRFLPTNNNFLVPKSRTSSAPSVPTDIKPSTVQIPQTKQDLQPSSYLHQNKTLIRKIASESLNNRGLFKHHAKFKDLFGAVCRGVQFALREALEKQSVDIYLTRTFVESHLAMYMIHNNSNINHQN